MGHSEGREVGGLWSRTLRNYGFAREVAVVTINDLSRPEICDEVSDMLSAGTLYTHSAFPVHLDKINGQLGQIVAFNPPEATKLPKLVRGMVQVAGDKHPKEAGAHDTGVKDLTLAGIEMFAHPRQSIDTVRKIVGGFSTLDYLMQESDRFPLGRLVVHSALDGFNFPANFDYECAETNGIRVARLEGHHHNEVLFRPLDAMRRAGIRPSLG